MGLTAAAAMSGVTPGMAEGTTVVTKSTYAAPTPRAVATMPAMASEERTLTLPHARGPMAIRALSASRAAGPEALAAAEALDVTRRPGDATAGALRLVAT